MVFDYLWHFIFATFQTAEGWLSGSLDNLRQLLDIDISFLCASRLLFQWKWQVERDAVQSEMSALHVATGH